MIEYRAQVPPEPPIGSVVVSKMDPENVFMKTRTGWVPVGRMLLGGGYSWLSVLDTYGPVILVWDGQGVVCDHEP